MVGQAWVFSTQEGNSSRVVEGMHSGELLSEIWKNHPDYFHSHYENSPFIVGLVAPEDSLSMQVHPDQQYANKHGLASGKNEAWYFIDAKDKNQLLQWIDEEKWDDIVRRIPVKTGEFIYVPAGLLHAMQKDVVAYEVQEATDITFRFYDYGRKDSSGKTRELHLKEAEECSTIFKAPVSEIPVETKIPNGICITYIDNESFKIQKYVFEKESMFKPKEYMLVTVIKGEGKINNHHISKGTNFIIPANMEEFMISGNMEWMVTSEGKKG